MKAYKETVRKYYKYQNWTQPVLSANGILGGDSFACANTTNSGSYPVWKMFDNNASTFADMRLNEEIIFYNPIKLKVSNISFTNRSGYNYAIKAYEIYVSNDNVNWNFIKSGSNSVTSSGQTWNISLNITNTYKYYKIKVTDAALGSGYFQEAELIITASTVITGTSSDYDFYEDVDVYSLHKESSSGIYPVDKTVVNLRSGTQSLNLKAGTEGYIEIVGAGGRECQIWNGWNYRSNGGGSGGRFSCNFVATADVTLNFTCGVRSGNNNPGGASYIDVGGSRFATANGGQTEPREVAPGGAGGTASYTAISGLTLSNIQTITGNTGASVVNGNPGNAASVASTGTYGKGGSGGYNGPNNDEENGWCYVHYTKEFITVDTYKAFNV